MWVPASMHADVCVCVIVCVCESMCVCVGLCVYVLCVVGGCQVSLGM